MWGSLSKDILNLIFNHLPDGRTGVYCKRTCKKWKEVIDNNKKMQEFIKEHYIKVEDYDYKEVKSLYPIEYPKEMKEVWKKFINHKEIITTLTQYPITYMNDGSKLFNTGIASYFQDCDRNLVVNIRYNTFLEEIPHKKHVFNRLHELKLHLSSVFIWRYIELLTQKCIQVVFKMDNEKNKYDDKLYY